MGWAGGAGTVSRIGPPELDVFLEVTEKGRGLSNFEGGT